MKSLTLVIFLFSYMRVCYNITHYVDDKVRPSKQNL